MDYPVRQLERRRQALIAQYVHQEMVDMLYGLWSREEIQDRSRLTTVELDDDGEFRHYYHRLNTDIGANNISIYQRAR